MASLADRAKYTVGWVAPMALELAPAIAILERHGTLQVAGDDALYHVGQIGGHCVAMVVCPRIGTHAAATVVANMRRSFQNIKHILVVGIAGGVPNYGASLQEQIVLGDVVVSVPQYNEGGVAHYEFGAWEGEGRLTRSGHTLHPSSALLTAVNSLRAFRMQKRGTLISRFLRDLRQCLDEDELLEFKDPGPEHDHLFEDDYPHTDSTKLCNELCDGSKSKRRENRGIKAMRKEDQPFIHYGTIGSANTLVMSSTKRNALYEEYGVIAFEMESAGVLSDSQGLVVRGICDYADSHKNKKWQKYAAATAAACAKEILLLIPAEAIATSAERSLSEKLEPTVNYGAPAELVLRLVDLPNIEGIRKAMKSCIKLLGLEVDTDFLLKTRDATSEKMMHDRQKAISRIRDNYRGATERCRRSLAFKDMMVREEIIAQPEHDTCQWIYLESQYKQWISNKNPLLWIKGNPGSGKSILMKSIFKQRQQLFDESSTILLSFFFNGRGSDMERSQEALYRTLLHSLISSNPLLSCEVLVLYLEKETRGNSFRWQTTELADIFHQKLQRFQSNDIEILIDALDECSDEEVFDVVRRFEKTIQNRSNRKNLRVCWSSRFYPTISLRTIQGIELVVNENNTGDIQEYIQNIFPIGSHESLRSVGREIISRANGTFLWASLVANKLSKAFDEGKDADQLKAMLHIIPDGLDNLFLSIFDDSNFTTEQREDLQRFAPFVLGVSRPLSVEELYAALLLEGPRQNWSFSDLTLRPDNIQQFKKRLTHASGGLIEVAGINESSGLQHSKEGDLLTCTGRTNKRIRRTFLQCGGRDGSNVPDWKITTTRVQVIHESVREFFLGKGLPVMQASSRKWFMAKCHSAITRAGFTILRKMATSLNVTSRQQGNKQSSANDRILNSLIPKQTWCPPQIPFLLGYVQNHIFTHLDHVCRGRVDEDQTAQWLPRTTICKKALYAYLRIGCFEVIHNGRLTKLMNRQLRIASQHAEVFQLNSQTFANLLDFPNRLMVSAEFLRRRGIYLRVGAENITPRTEDMHCFTAVFSARFRYLSIDPPPPEASTPVLDKTKTKSMPSFIDTTDDEFSFASEEGLEEGLEELSKEGSDIFSLLFGISFCVPNSVAPRLMLPDRLSSSIPNYRNRKESVFPVDLDDWQVVTLIDQDVCSLPSDFSHNKRGGQLTFSNPSMLACTLLHWGLVGDFSSSTKIRPAFVQAGTCDLTWQVCSESNELDREILFKPLERPHTCAVRPPTRTIVPPAYYPSASDLYSSRSAFTRKPKSFFTPSIESGRTRLSSQFIPPDHDKVTRLFIQSSRAA